MDEGKLGHLKIYQSRAYIIVNLSVLALIFFVIWRLHVGIYRVIFFVLDISVPADFRLSILTTMVILTIYAMIALYSAIQWKNTYFEISPGRFVKRWKVITMHETTINSSDFVYLGVTQGLIGRLLSYGDIMFNLDMSSDLGRGVMPNISHPHQQAKLIKEIFSREKKINPEPSNISLESTENSEKSNQSSETRSQINEITSKLEIR